MKTSGKFAVVVVAMIVGLVVTQARSGFAQVIPPTLTDILVPEVPHFRVTERPAAGHLGGDVNGLLDLVGGLPTYIDWGCATRGGPPSTNKLWINLRKETATSHISDVKLESVTCQSNASTPTGTMNCSITFSGGNWKPALVFVGGGTGSGPAVEGRTVTITGVANDAGCVPYLIIFP